jgi:CBS domain-containing membrane protein
MPEGARDPRIVHGFSSAAQRLRALLLSTAGAPCPEPARRLLRVVDMKVEIPASVSDVMTRDVVSVAEDDTLSNLLGSLKALRFRHLPVTDEDRLIGLVTERDLLALASSTLLPHHGMQDQAIHERFRVRDIMIRDVLTVSPETSLQQAGRLLLKQRFGCLPVVDGSNVLVGILTSSDFIKLVANARAAAGSRTSGGSDLVQ